jgi:septum formation inhibitor-activating ATPase MinD
MCSIAVLCSSCTGIAAGASGAGVNAAAAIVLVTVEIPMMKINRRIEYF